MKKKDINSINSEINALNNELYDVKNKCKELEDKLNKLIQARKDYYASNNFAFFEYNNGSLEAVPLNPDLNCLYMNHYNYCNFVYKLDINFNTAYYNFQIFNEESEKLRKTINKDTFVKKATKMLNSEYNYFIDTITNSYVNSNYENYLACNRRHKPSSEEYRKQWDKLIKEPNQDEKKYVGRFYKNSEGTCYCAPIAIDYNGRIPSSYYRPLNAPSLYIKDINGTKVIKAFDESGTEKIEDYEGMIEITRNEFFDAMKEYLNNTIEYMTKFVNGEIVKDKSK